MVIELFDVAFELHAKCCHFVRFACWFIVLWLVSVGTRGSHGRRLCFVYNLRSSTLCPAQLLGIILQVSFFVNSSKTGWLCRKKLLF
jgi:hypothetical protein